MIPKVLKVSYEDFNFILFPTTEIVIIYYSICYVIQISALEKYIVRSEHYLNICSSVKLV